MRGAFYGVLTGLLLFWIPVGACTASMARAQPDVLVCDYLDQHPTVAGLEDLGAMAIYGNGMTPEQAGQFIVGEIGAYCPRHLVIWDEAQRKYKVGPYAEGKYKI